MRPHQLLKQFPLVVLLMFAFIASAQKNMVLKSPDGKLVFSFKMKADLPVYTVNYQGEKMIDESGLGFSFKESGAFGAGLKTPKAIFSKVDDHYDLVVGKTKTVHEVYQQLRIPLIEAKEKGRRIDLVVRAFNDGVAFRYEFPKQENWTEYTMTAENSVFNIAGNPKIRTLLFSTPNNAHEGLYEKMPLSSLKEGPMMDMPALFEFADKKYMAITEANLREMPSR